MLNQRTFTQTTTDWNSEVAVSNPVHRQAAYALLRVTLGIVFLFSGVSKFMASFGREFFRWWVSAPR